MEKVKKLNLVQITAPLTPNVSIACNAHGDESATTELSLINKNSAIYWTVMISKSNNPVKFQEDKTKRSVTVKMGSKFNLQETGDDMYTIFFDGIVADEDIEYPISNKLLCTFPL
jgi:hypothetical protein